MDLSMRDDTTLVLSNEKSQRTSAEIIPFPVRNNRSARSNSANIAAAIAEGLEPRSRQHAPTLLAASGALAGFAAQQALMLEGGASWAQPMRAKRLDHLLLSSDPSDGSLWWTLSIAAQELGAQHLPEPQTLLAATLKCVGTTQFGQITLPLEYKLNEQPQAALTRLWPRVSETLEDAATKPAAWPRLMATICAERVVTARRDVPPHVSLRIIMQAALAMALIEPRLIHGAAVKAL
jgi:hypothetical protein